MANPLWKAGETSPNPLGRPKGSVRSGRRNLERLASLILTIKEVKNNYDHMKPGVERWGMQKELMGFVYPKVQAGSISDDELFAIYERLENKITNDVQGQKKAG